MNMYCSSEWQDFDQYEIKLDDSDRKNIKEAKEVFKSHPTIFKLVYYLNGNLRIYNNDEDMSFEGS